LTKLADQIARGTGPTGQDKIARGVGCCAANRMRRARQSG
jgi:hypothetical protein